MIYKVRVILETEEDVFRDIEIKGTQTLWNLYEGIKSAFSLQGEELASFYKSDEKWSQGEEIPLEDMSEDGDGETMSDVYVKEALANIGDRLLFVYDFIKMWSFYVELTEIIEKKPVVNYPLTVYRFGKMPLKAPDKKFASSTNIEDFGDVVVVDDDVNLKFDTVEVDSYEDEEEDDSYGDLYEDEEDEK